MLMGRAERQILRTQERAKTFTRLRAPQPSPCTCAGCIAKGELLEQLAAAIAEPCEECGATALERARAQGYPG